MGMAAGDFRKVDDNVFVAGQLGPDDFAAAKVLGVRTVINNRPDGEAFDQLPSAEAERLARAAGLDYLHLPLANGGPLLEVAAAFGQALGERGGPFLAYCRSGTRSCHLWALSAVRERPVEAVVAAAAGAGYDLRGARPLLERAAGSAQATSQR
jgi:uncharacterized protein (TIGR01244 family)